MNASQWADLEPLLEDNRLERVVDKLRSQFGHATLDDARFVTFVSPAREVTRTTEAGLQYQSWIKEMATFAVIEPNPRPYAKAKNLEVMTHGTVALEDWEEDERDFKHFVGKPDPAFRIYQLVVKDHVERIKNLKEMN